MVSEPSTSERLRLPLWVLVAAVAAPPLLAFNFPPSPTLLNQCFAAGLWGVAVTTLLLRAAPTRGHMVGAAVWALHGALAVTTLSIVVQVAIALPFGIAVGTAATLFGAMTVAEAGSDSAHGSSLKLLEALATAFLVAGLLSAIIGCIQVFAPDWPDGDLIARSGVPGRAVGNVRQPNHLSSLLLLALIALFVLRELRRTPDGVVLAAGALLVFAVVLTGSRTGMLGMVVLGAWGLLDRRLLRRTRISLMASLLLFAAMWTGMAEWAHAAGHAFGGEGRLALGNGDISSSRFAIWSNALAMIAREPWTGVGFGEFNIAWTLTAFPDRPTAFFDHTHNLPLQLLVELGIPLGSLVIVLLLVALVQAGRRAWACDGDEGVARRAAFMMVLMIGLHSMLEYPLWYAYFLLPTAFAWGFALSRPLAHSAKGDEPAPASPPRSQRALAFAGLAMTIGAAAAVLDYRRVVVIYAPPEGAAPLEERIALGQRSPLFGHHADYAAATAFGEPKAPLSPSQQLAFRRAPHQLLDVRLMIAWSQALAAVGDLDKARWLAARIKEFRNPGADEYFAPCQDPALAAQAFQCQPPQRVVHWREFTQQQR